MPNHLHTSSAQDTDGKYQQRSSAIPSLLLPPSDALPGPTYPRILLSISCSFYSDNGNSLLTSHSWEILLMLRYLEDRLSSCQKGVRCAAWPEICIQYLSRNWVLAPSYEQMKRGLRGKGVWQQQGQPSQPAAVHSQPQLSGHTKLWRSMQTAFYFHTASLQAPSAFEICLKNSSPLSCSFPTYFSFVTRMPTLEDSAALSSSVTVTTFVSRQKTGPWDISQELGCDTVCQARHRTTSTDNLVPPHSPSNKKTSISTHRQTSTPLSQCH